MAKRKLIALHAVTQHGKDFAPGSEIDNGSDDDRKWLVDNDAAAWEGDGKAALPQLDHDDDGDPGGDLPDDPPALSGKTKAELTAIAEEEGADISASRTNAEIIEAIEAHRAEQSDEDGDDGDGGAPAN